MNVDLGDVTLHVRDPAPVSRWSCCTAGRTPVTCGGIRYPRSPRPGTGSIAPDLRGFGGSSKPTDLAAYTAPVLVGDVIGLLDALGIQRAHLVGHDWGAAVTWMTAALAPDRVASMTALSVGHPASFRSAGWRQREKSWYMLLFQFAGIAERWLSGRRLPQPARMVGAPGHRAGHRTAGRPGGADREPLAVPRDPAARIAGRAARRRCHR